MAKEIVFTNDPIVVAAADGTADVTVANENDFTAQLELTTRGPVWLVKMASGGLHKRLVAPARRGETIPCRGKTPYIRAHVFILLQSRWNPAPARGWSSSQRSSASTAASRPCRTR